MNLTRTAEWSAGVGMASMGITVWFNLSGRGVMVVDFMGYCAGPALGLWLLAILVTGRSLESAFATAWIIALPLAGLLGASLGTGVLSP